LGANFKNANMTQIIRELSEEMTCRLESQRKWVKDHYDEENIGNYETLGGKLVLLDTILKSGIIDKKETVKLQCLGVALGDAVIQDLGLRWIEIEDDFGIDPALQYLNTSLILFPLTMISKRIESDETVDIVDFYKKLTAYIIRIKDKVD
jgi:hypothetical protein